VAKLGIDPADWAELNRLLDRALDQPSDSSAEWLNSLDRKHQDLKPQLRALLEQRAKVETGQFLAAPPAIGLTSPATTKPNKIGPYRLLREIGRGGMGSVWLAARDDALVRRTVALKLPHMLSPLPGLAERLTREREILATLEHASIARLYDVGLTESGQPYLALEYVEGTSIDVFCQGTADRPAPDLVARLRLFVKVAEAVAYAHGKLVLHRDIKPANILVTDDGQVKLLDFGVAKLMESGTTRDTKLTELAGRAMTPDYASPEQILGESLSVTSDVYSLGVVLYEILTGTRPYRLKRDSRGALEEAVLQTEPPRPSNVAPRSLQRALRGDLDNVVLRSLKKRPSERYATANALVEDIQRYLEHRPVLAQPDSRWYRLRKFVVRNRLAVAASAAIALAILGGASIALWQARLALTEQQRAENVKDLIARVFEAADPDVNGGRQLTAGELLEQASSDLNAVAIEDPYVRVEIQRVIASSLMSVKSLDAAEQLATAALSDAQRHLPADHPQTLQAKLLMASVWRYRGMVDAWRKELDEVWRYADVLRAAAPRDYDLTLGSWAALEIDTVHYDAALAWARRRLTFSEAQFGSASAETLRALATLSTALSFAKLHSEELEVGRRAFLTAQRLYRGVRQHPRVIDSRTAYARALYDNGQYAMAIGELQTAIADGEAVWGPRNMTVGFYWQMLANAAARGGQLDVAVRAAQESYAIGKAQGVAQNSMTWVSRLTGLARPLIALRRWAEAVPVLQELLLQMPKVVPPGDTRLYSMRADLALARYMLGDKTAGAADARSIVGELELLRESRPYRPYLVLGKIERYEQRNAAAIRALETAVHPTVRIRDDAERAEVLVEMALSRIAMRQFAVARQNLTDAQQLLDAAGHADTPVRAELQTALASLAKLNR
jgi:serine/threonine protein kinase